MRRGHKITLAFGLLGIVVVTCAVLSEAWPARTPQMLLAWLCIGLVTAANCFLISAGFWDNEEPSKPPPSNSQEQLPPQ